ncbi:MAG: MmcQ/YjbR family DNA-binding protein [Nitratireductor sp.]|nr:MmcQ/YjbR family DNA-binding protein [Nitratireductor sp.]
MVTSEAFRQWALAFEGAVEAPHFDRTAFRAKRIFATMPADGMSANLVLTPDQQEMQCGLYPEVFSPVANKWGERGWTTASFAAAQGPELRAALEIAWQNGCRK